jgi:hypothetical protein
LEEENLVEYEDTLICIICGQLYSEDGTEGKLTVEMGFISAIRRHDGIATARCGDVSQHLGGIISSGVHEFHISCMNTFSTNFTLESCL